jgi:SAM-dependent methyltransferase
VTVDAIERVREHYEESLAAHGPSARGVGWPDPEGQALRFERLARILDADGAADAVRVADLGCGYGALLAFLDARPGPRIEAYHGYDVSPAMVAEARRRTPDARARFAVGTAVHDEVDYGFASGTFNVRLGADPVEWDAYVRAALRDLWAHTERGIAFNLMTTHVDWRSEDLFYADPATYVAFCQHELSARVLLQHDYGLHEWTMIVLR